MRGSLLACDHPRFAAVQLGGNSAAPRRAFVVVARLAPIKCIQFLIEAWRRYHAVSDASWPLILYGTGPLAGAFDGLPGIDHRGFVQPSKLPAVMADAECLVIFAVATVSEAAMLAISLEPEAHQAEMQTD